MVTVPLYRRKILSVYFAFVAILAVCFFAYFIYSGRRELLALDELQTLESEAIISGYVYPYRYPNQRIKLDEEDIAILASACRGIREFTPEHPVFDSDSWIVTLQLASERDIQLHLFTKVPAQNVWGEVVRIYPNPESLPSATTVVAWFQCSSLRKWVDTVSAKYFKSE